MNKINYFLLSVLLFAGFSLKAQENAGVWPAEKSRAWYAKHQWLVGANFIPSTAINQLEMWQSDTFDPKVIDRELGFAQGIGMNVMRVFLHHLAWQQDPEGFKKRMRTYLDLSGKHGIQTIFVFFDDCWNKTGKTGKQPLPKPGIHNSGWLQDPGDPAYKEPAGYALLERYVKDVIGAFRSDERVLLWDLYNEPGNSGKGESSLPLLKQVFLWARAAKPDQPLTAGIWKWDLESLNLFQAAQSDVITYHDYTPVEEHLKVVQLLKMHGKPLICTEYMARSRNSLFATVLPMLQKEGVGAVNWGLVAGKTNTIYAWDAPMPDGAEPDLWFHDIFRKDGSPYKKEETDKIKQLTQREK